jgi:ABC transporter
MYLCCLHTGAGKSSLINCIFRLMDLDSGKITIDGIDISRLGVKQLRSRMAIIPQARACIACLLSCVQATMDCARGCCSDHCRLCRKQPRFCACGAYCSAALTLDAGQRRVACPAVHQAQLPGAVDQYSPSTSHNQIRACEQLMLSHAGAAHPTPCTLVLPGAGAVHGHDARQPGPL